MSNWEKLQAKLKAQPPAPAAASNKSYAGAVVNGNGKGNGGGKSKAGAVVKGEGAASQKQQHPGGGGGKKRRRWDLSEAAQREAAERQARAEQEGKLQRVEAEGAAVLEKERYLGLDCEMVGVGADGQRSALARVTLVDFDGRVVYDEHVRPVERVTDFRTWVSGVKAKHLKEAISLKDCIKQVGELVRGKVIVGHALQNDLQALLLQHPVAMVRDTARYRPYMRPHGRGGGKLRPRRLKDLAQEVLGMEIQEGKHDSGEDARAAMLLYRARREEWEKELRKKHVHKYRITTGVSAKAITTSTSGGTSTTTTAAVSQQTTTTTTTTVVMKKGKGKK